MDVINLDRRIGLLCSLNGKQKCVLKFNKNLTVNPPLALNMDMRIYVYLHIFHLNNFTLRPTAGLVNCSIQCFADNNICCCLSNPLKSGPGKQRQEINSVNDLLGFLVKCKLENFH